ncbi:MAG TPA: hypothetical protein VGF51_17335 [Acidimicrobiales bacterium]
MAVNIAAVMKILDVWDLDGAAKHALLVVACRSGRYTAAAPDVSIGRISADMKVCYQTARTALDRAVEAGYLTVDKSPGLTPTWRLTSRLVSDPTSRPVEGDLASQSRGPRDSGSLTKESLDTTKDGGADASARDRRASPPLTPEERGRAARILVLGPEWADGRPTDNGDSP